MKPFSAAERHVIDSAVGYFTLGCFVFAPFAYGATRPEGAFAMAGWLFMALLLAIAKWVLVDHRPPRVPWFAAVLLLLLNMQGWFMVWNARMLYEPLSGAFMQLINPFPFLPGAVDGPTARTGMWVISGLSAGFMVLADLAADAVWRKRILATMAATGAAIALVGLILKLAGPGAMELFWEEEKISETNFAFFRYHGNAAAFLNLTWPLALAFFLGRFSNWKELSKSGAWLACFAVIFAAGMINISKAGVALAALMLLIFAGWRWRVYRARQKTAPTETESSSDSPVVQRAYRIIAVVLVVAFVGFIVATAATSTSGWSRWLDLAETRSRQNSVEARLTVYEIAGNMVVDAGGFGMGASTFSIAFPRYAKLLSEPLWGSWRYPHEDYLQTLIEWGWWGAALWALFYGGGLLRGWRAFRTRTNFSSSEDRLLVFACCLVLMGIALHATFDFPFQIGALRLYALGLLAVCWNAHRYATETLTTLPPPTRKRRRS